MKNLYLLILLCALGFTSFSQTLLIGGATENGDFENGTSGWTFVNGSQANQWIVGANATPGFSGSNAVYISSNGSSHQYNTNSATYSYFYKDIAVPAGAKTLWLVFDYISNGEVISTPFGNDAKDALRIWARTTAETPVAGQELSNVFISAGAGFYKQPTWKKKRVLQLPAATFSGNTMRLIFQWFNDGSNGNQPPAAIDNIELYSSCQEFVAPAADNNITGTSATIVWTTVGGATGYQLRYKKLSDPNSVLTYTNPVIINGANVYYYTINGLTPSTDYIAEVSPIGLSCTEYSSPAVFTTLDAPLNDDCSGAITLPVWSATQPGTIATFRGSTPSAVAGSCANSANNDVWFRFVAQQSEQTIITSDPDFGENFYSAKDIVLYTGSCGSLTAVGLPCATDTMSVYQGSTITRLKATGLTPGTTYYIRVNTDNNTGYDNFAISIYNPMSAPSCPQQLRPVQDTVLNYGTPFVFSWKSAAGADAYRVRIFAESGALTQVFTRDTSFVFSPVAGTNYTWLAQPYNVLGQSTGCTAATFSTCPSIANTITLSSAGVTSKCAGDSIKITASSGTNIQWFRNNVAIPGATADTLWVKQGGAYTVRVVSGSCFSDPSNIINIVNLATPAKPSLTKSGATSFCDGGSVTLTSSIDLNNQWYNGTTELTGFTDPSYTATTTGNYYIKISNAVTGCAAYSDTVAVTVTATVVPTISSATNSFCEGDSLKLRASSLSDNQWYRNNVLISGATDSVYFAKQAGDYTVTTTSTGCFSGTSNILSVTASALPATPVVTVTGATSFCEGDSVKLNSSANSGNLWLLNGTSITGATNPVYYAKSGGSYTVKQQANGCSSAASAATAVTVNPLPAKPVITANGFVLSAPAGFASYQWYLNGAPIAGSTSAQQTVLVAGNYKVEVSDNKNCKNISDNFNAVVTGTNDVDLLGFRISLYPNPVTDFLTINVKPNNGVPQKITATVTDIYGKLLLVQQLKEGSNLISLHQYAQGHYLVSIRNGNNVKTVKVVRAR